MHIAASEQLTDQLMDEVCAVQDTQKHNKHNEETKGSRLIRNPL